MSYYDAFETGSLSRLPVTTRRTYRYALGVFDLFMNPVDKDGHALEPRAFDRETLVDYELYLAKAHPPHDKPARPRTAALYVGVAKRYLRWLSLTGHLERSLYADMADYLEAYSAAPHVGYVARAIDPEIAGILDYYVNVPLPEKGAVRLRLLRNRALLVFLYDTACRISEALALTRADAVDGRAERVVLRETKGHKARTVILHDQSRALLQAYLAERHDSASAALFLSHGRGHNAALSSHRAWEIVREAAEGAGLHTSTSAHSLRHKRAQDLLNSGVSLDLIAALLGHEDAGITQRIYAPYIDVDRLDDALKGKWTK